MLSSRSTHLSTDARAGAKTPGRENAINRTLVSKGVLKNNAFVPLEPNVGPSNNTKNVPAKLIGRELEVARPLVDKTPFPNRAATSNFKTPLPDNQKLAKLLLEANKTNALLSGSKGEPTSAARASSGRTHARAPRLSANINFQTPLINGNPWDVSESEIAPPEVVATHIPAPEPEEYDEIEYMPPKVVDVYTPPFDFALPDYSTVGKTLLGVAHSYPYEDDAPRAESDPAVEPGRWDMFTLPEIKSDDPFPASKPRTRTQLSTTSSRLAQSRPVTTSSRPGTSIAQRFRLANPRSAASTTVTSGAKMQAPSGRVQRPATAAAMYRPSALQKRKNLGIQLVPIIDSSSPDIGDHFLFDI
ncbi:hypothetical protein DFH06DRAFT_1101224 [Mycena polygramma]|nr:hypothetical protein DFH06DRAFT_1101224 [Mycena polygramma]